METKIKEILETELPKDFNIVVERRKNAFGGGERIKIDFSPNTYSINGVGGQYPQLVSLNLDLTDMELNTQVFGGMGGGRIYREIDENHPKEKYLAMFGVKVPFRKPKREEKFVLNAIRKFAQNYLKTLKEHRDVLRYQNEVDYSFLD